MLVGFFLHQFQALSFSESVSFIIGGNDLEELRMQMEIETLKKIIDLFKTRKRHFEQLLEEQGKESLRKQNRDFIKNLLS